MRFRFSLSILAIGLLAPPLVAQHAVPVGVARGSLDVSPAVADSSTDIRPSKKRYLISGAVLGATLTIVGFSFYTKVSLSDVLTSPAVILGSFVGAGAGYLVYRLRF